MGRCEGWRDEDEWDCEVEADVELEGDAVCEAASVDGDVVGAAKDKERK
jgi:hypothetical protein